MSGKARKDGIRNEYNGYTLDVAPFDDKIRKNCSRWFVQTITRKTRETKEIWIRDE